MVTEQQSIITTQANTIASLTTRLQALENQNLNSRINSLESLQFIKLYTTIYTSGYDTKTVTLPTGYYLIIWYQGGAWQTAAWLYTATGWQAHATLISSNNSPGVTITNNTPSSSQSTLVVTLKNPSAAVATYYIYKLV